MDRLDAGLSYPRGLGQWPAVVFLFVALWAELVLPESETPVTVANLMLGYTILTLAGMMLFGRVAWLRHAELFEVLLGWFGRIGLSVGGWWSNRSLPGLRGGVRPRPMRGLPRVLGRR